MEEGGAALGADQFGNPVPKRKIVSRAAAEAAERVERQERLRRLYGELSSLG